MVMKVNPNRLGQQICELVSQSISASTSDGVLLDRFVSCQDEYAFSALVSRHGPMVLGACRRILNGTQDAEDACQATFLVLARRAAAIHKPESLAAWLHGTAIRLALRCRRAEVRRRCRESRSAQVNTAPSQPDPLDELSARELLAILDEELQRLPEANRLPLILCLLEG